jgi:type IV fimbrial biogenesis protein FimT
MQMRIAGSVKRQAGVAAEQGLTLVELMVTVAILAILLAVAVPNMSSYWQQSRLVSASEAVYSNLHLLRSVALARNQQIYAKFDNTGGTGWCMALAELDSCDCADATTTCALTNMPVPRLSGSDYSNITLSTTFGGDSTSVSMPRGTMANGSVVLTSQSTGDVVKVVVSSFGRVKICSDDLDQYGDCP